MSGIGMLGIGWKILSILGMAFCAFLLLAFSLLLLLLFFPFTYRVCGGVDGEGRRLSVKVNWLFGLFRIRFGYPEPGRLSVKLLCFSLFRRKPSRAKPKKPSEDSGPERAMPEDAGRGSRREQTDSGEAGQQSGQSGAANDGKASTPAEDRGGLFGKISGKIRKIRYTVRDIYGKIKKVWENLSFYTELLQEEDTKLLTAHVVKRACKVLKSIRPRRMKGWFLFGTGSPDTTGYLYGLYCIIAPLSGIGCSVTPDFEQKRFEGEFDAAGRAVAWIFLVNGLKLFWDRRLRALLRRLRTGPGTAGKGPA